MGLIGRAGLDLLRRVVAPRRDVEEVDSVRRQGRGQPHRVLLGPALGEAGRVVLEPVGGADAEEERHRRRDHVADQVDELEHQPRAVLEAAAVLVGALVRDRRHELVQQVAVRAVDLDDVEAGSQRAVRGGREGGFELLDLGSGHGVWLCQAFRVRDLARRFDVVGPAADHGARDIAGAEPGSHGAGFAAGVAELDADLLVLRVGELDDPPEGLDLAVLPQTAVFGRDATFREHGGGFNKREPRSALDYAAEMG